MAWEITRWTDSWVGWNSKVNSEVYGTYKPTQLEASPVAILEIVLHSGDLSVIEIY